MRTKTRAVKRRPSNSIPPSNASVISSPLLYQDEANEEDHVDANDNGASEDNDSSQDNDNNNNDVDGKDDDYDNKDEDDDDRSCGGGGDYHNFLVPDDGDDDDDDEEEEEENGGGDDDNVVIPDSVEEVDRRAGGNHAAGPSRDCIVVDWLEGEFCICCNRLSGQVLVCGENGCPVAIHEVCMKCEPKFDDTGKFHCPYCWYKRELAKAKELRRKAMLAKKELSNFIRLKRDGRNEEKQEDEAENMKAASVSTMAGKINSGDCENGLNDDVNSIIYYNQEGTLGVESISKEKSDNESVSKAHGFDNVGDGERIQEEDIENASDSEDEEIDEDQWQIQPNNPNHLEIAKGTLFYQLKKLLTL